MFDTSLTDCGLRAGVGFFFIALTSRKTFFLSVRICGGPGCATHWNAIGIICRLNARPHWYASARGGFLSVVFFAWLRVLLSDVPGMNIDNLAAYLSRAGL